MTLELRIDSILPVSDRISLFTLSAADGTELPDYSAGSHLVFDLGTLGTRSYSLVDLPGNTDRAYYRIAVQREDGGAGGSMQMHRLEPGAILRASPPKNDFALHDGPTPALLIAGGIGVTPILSFATDLAAAGRDYQFHYCTRSAGLAAFAADLETAHGARMHLWYDDSRPVDLPALLNSAPKDAHVYVCGPKGMIEAVKRLADEAGFPTAQVHFELFCTPQPEAGDTAFEVVLKSTGESYVIPPGRTIVEVLEAAGIDLIYDCQRGDCGICQTEIIEGIADHRDVVLSDAEKAAGKVMQICVSRARSQRLVLDL